MEMGGNIYYSDTDSLVTDILLPESMVNSHELGLLKLEHVVIKAIFNNNKTYWLLVRDNNGELMVINKALGYSSNSLSFNNHLSLLLGVDVSAKKVLSKIEWIKGYVTIDDDKGVKVNANSYKGHTKVKLDILKKNGIIFCSNTDSIVTYKDLSKQLVGEKIGQSILQHNV